MVVVLHNEGSRMSTDGVIESFKIPKIKMQNDNAKLFHSMKTIYGREIDLFSISISMQESTK